VQQSPFFSEPSVRGAKTLACEACGESQPCVWANAMYTDCASKPLRVDSSGPAFPQRMWLEEAMRLALHSVSYAGVWPGQARLTLEEFVPRQRTWGIRR